MSFVEVLETNNRYYEVTEQKSSGATYTPKDLADFVASQMVRKFNYTESNEPIKILDPAIGEGELILSLLRILPQERSIEVYGFDTSEIAIARAEYLIQLHHPKTKVFLKKQDFLLYLVDNYNDTIFFNREVPTKFDLVIANPPYVRTQILGAEYSKILAKTFSLNGRVDLYHAFILGITNVLNVNGVCGIIVSNRFMTTKSGVRVRQSILKNVNLCHIWDLGDTKLFNAAVLPAVMLAEGRNRKSSNNVIRFTSIYETKEISVDNVFTWIEALNYNSVVQISNSKYYEVKQGVLDNKLNDESVWKLTNEFTDNWLEKVKRNTWKTFGQISKVRVGVKTCSDKVFIQKNWSEITNDEIPELLIPLATHHIANRFRVIDNEKQRHILYTHENKHGKSKPVDIALFPNSLKYLERNKSTLQKRTYLIEGGRKWYELWVPQNPNDWLKTKLIFRDISERPCFWIDTSKTVVNGDCYWMVCDKDTSEDLLWLALAVSNSTFIEMFYDKNFNNKLYSGRRRFITQYVEKFPLPNPETDLAKDVILTVKKVYESVGTDDFEKLEADLDKLVWSCFDLAFKEA